MKILVTGAAGFIGFHMCSRLLKEKYSVLGIDNFNNYYDRSLKHNRIKELLTESENIGVSFTNHCIDLKEKSSLLDFFKKYKPDYVIHLAAQAGVRYSITNPSVYLTSNLLGFGNILECCREFKIKHLIYASSSSVYGGNTKMPFSEDDNVDHPVSLYAATKKSNELMAHTYSHLFNIPTTGLRFFTVYGPWGRPDMALFLFTKAILNNEEIKVFNNGNMLRDFTYIDDIIESIFRLIDKPPFKNPEFERLQVPSESWAPYKIFNIGNSKPVKLMDYIEALETSLNKKSRKIFLPMQSGDVKATFSDSSKLEEWVQYRPNTKINEGIEKFVFWYKNYYKIE